MGKLGNIRVWTKNGWCLLFRIASWTSLNLFVLREDHNHSVYDQPKVYSGPSGCQRNTGIHCKRDGPLER